MAGRLFLVVLALLLGALLLVAVLAARRRHGDPHRDAAWLAGTWVVPPDEVDVYARYLSRLRVHRHVGALFGILFAVVVGIVYTRTIGIGFSAAGPLGDVLYCGVAGVLVGAMSAEVYRLRLPLARMTATASLAPRPALPGASQAITARSLVAFAVVVAAVLAVTGHDVTTLVAALFGTLLVALCEVTRRAVAHRRRAALSERALVVDANLRTFAARTVAWLELTASVLAVAWTVVGAADAAWLPTEAGSVASLAALVAAVVLLVKASPRPPRRYPWTSPAPVAGTVPVT